MYIGIKYLEVLKLGQEIETNIDAIVERFSQEELTGLADEMRKISVHISSNIIESRRFDFFQVKESRQSLCTALRQCEHLAGDIEICFGLGCLDEDTMKMTLGKLDFISRLLKSLINGLFYVDDDEKV